MLNTRGANRFAVEVSIERPKVTTTRAARVAGLVDLQQRLGGVVDLDGVVGPEQARGGDDEANPFGERTVGQGDGLNGDEPAEGVERHAVAERLEAEPARALETREADGEGELQRGEHAKLCCNWHGRFLSEPGLRDPT